MKVGHEIMAAEIRWEKISDTVSETVWLFQISSVYSKVELCNVYEL
jgi:hypothetical protein